MELLQNFHNRVWIETGTAGFWQPVEYEKVSKYCTSCLKEGNTKEECKAAKTEHVTTQRRLQLWEEGGRNQVYRPVQ